MKSIYMYEFDYLEMKSSDWSRWSSNGLYASLHHPCFELMRNFLKNFFGLSWFSNFPATNQINDWQLWPMRSLYLFENRPKRELLIPKSFEPEERPINFRKGTNWTISRDALWPFIGLFSSFPSPSKSSIASKSALPTPRTYKVRFLVKYWKPRTIWPSRTA